MLIDQGDDILLTVGGDDPACKTLPLSITILRAPVSAALAEIIPAAEAQRPSPIMATQTGSSMIFQSPAVDLQAGQLYAQLAPGDDDSATIRRIDISVTGPERFSLRGCCLSPTEPLTNRRSSRL